MASKTCKACGELIPPGQEQLASQGNRVFTLIYPYHFACAQAQQRKLSRQVVVYVIIAVVMVAVIGVVAAVALDGGLNGGPG